jgi:hypothetical protein
VVLAYPPDEDDRRRRLGEERLDEGVRLEVQEIVELLADTDE